MDFLLAFLLLQRIREWHRTQTSNLLQWSAEDSLLPALAQGNDMCHDAGVCSTPLVFLYNSSSASCVSFFRSLSLFSILPCYPGSAYASVTERSTVRLWWAAHSHLAKRKMVYALPRQETDLSQWGSAAMWLHRLTSDFRNNLCLESCWSHAYLVV